MYEAVKLIVNNPELEENIKKVARWIVEDCDDKIGEIEWLLAKLFAEKVEWVKELDHCRPLNEDIYSVYGEVLEQLKGIEELKEREQKNERTLN